MIRSVLALRAPAGRGSELVETFARLDVLGAASEIPGFVRGELQGRCDDEDAMLVTAVWTSETAYEQWLRSPVRSEINRRLTPVLEHERLDAVLYQLVLEVSRDPSTERVA